ncbi:MAG: hypothetical protein ACK5MQ_18400 [Pikeienuella sp.]
MAHRIRLENATIANIRAEQRNAADADSFDFKAPEGEPLAMLPPAMRQPSYPEETKDKQWPEPNLRSDGELVQALTEEALDSLF